MDCLIVFIVFISTLFSTGSCTDCVRHHIRGNDTYYKCSTGCCYKWIHPCCEEISSYSDSPFFASSVFRIAIFCLLAIGLFITILLVRRQKMLKQARNNTNRPRQRTVPRGHDNPGATVEPDGDTSLPRDMQMSTVSGQILTQDMYLPPPYESLPPAYSTLPPAYREAFEESKKSGTEP